MWSLVKQCTLVLLLLLVAATAYGQTYNTQYITAKADSLLISRVGEAVFERYYRLDSSSYYEYTRRNGKPDYENLFEHRIIKKSFAGVNVRYRFVLDVYNRPVALDRVALDGKLRLKEQPDLSYLPQYVLNRQPCNFISDSVALDISRKILKKKGIQPVSVLLEYDYNRKLYTWTAHNVLSITDIIDGKKQGVEELVIMNAITGEVISYIPDALYGPMH